MKAIHWSIASHKRSRFGCIRLWNWMLWAEFTFQLNSFSLKTFQRWLLNFLFFKLAFFHNNFKSFWSSSRVVNKIVIMIIRIHTHYTYIQFHWNIGNPVPLITKMAATPIHALTHMKCSLDSQPLLLLLLLLFGSEWFHSAGLVVFVCEHLLSTQSMMTLLKIKKNIL